MRLLITSPIGDPRDHKTWSAAPANLSLALERRGMRVTAIDSACLRRVDKILLAIRNLVKGYPCNAVGWFEPARRRRAAYVAAHAQNARADLVLCTSTLDAPLGTGIDYALWIDNSWNLYRNSLAAPGFGFRAGEEIDRLEHATLRGAVCVFTFSQHVRDDIVQHYGIPNERVVAVGCGSGDLPAFNGEKNFSGGHLLFVAKHLFASKGGELVLEAFDAVRKRRPQTRLVLVGSKEIVKRVRNMPGVEAHGFVSRESLIAFFHGAAMLVQPMFSDPWGQVYIEAMKARALVVGLHSCAVPELTDEGRLGVLISNPSAESLADAVLEAYARPQAELDAITRKAQQRALRLYNWDEVARRVLDALRNTRRL